MTSKDEPNSHMNADRLCGLSPANARPSDQKSPCIEQLPVSWAADQKACEVSAYCCNSSYSLAAGMDVLTGLATTWTLSRRYFLAFSQRTLLFILQEQLPVAVAILAQGRLAWPAQAGSRRLALTRLFVVPMGWDQARAKQR